MEGYHSSVLLKKSLCALIPTGLLTGRDAWYLDCTLGDGGHSIEIIKRGGRIVGIDVDPQALRRVQKRFEAEGIEQNKYKLIQGNFRDIKNLIKQPVSPNGGRGEQADTVDLKFAGAIFDLGVSSLQLETPQRGFSFMKEGPLDMRMDPTLAIKALDLVNNLSGKELDEIFKQLGEEKYSKRVADFIVSSRQVKQFETTLELAWAIEKAVGRSGRIHPATKVFQALRIFVNDELGALKEGLNEVVNLIKKDGCIVIISFHSLEDRIVKFTFKEWEDRGLGKIMSKKPITPTDSEVSENPRSRSAKMRIFKRL